MAEKKKKKKSNKPRKSNRKSPEIEPFNFQDVGMIAGLHCFSDFPLEKVNEILYSKDNLSFSTFYKRFTRTGLRESTKEIKKILSGLIEGASYKAAFGAKTTTHKYKIKQAWDPVKQEWVKIRETTVLVREEPPNPEMIKYIDEKRSREKDPDTIRFKIKSSFEKFIEEKESPDGKAN